MMAEVPTGSSATDDPLHDLRGQTPNPVTIGTRAAKRRQDRGMTVEELAVRAGIGVQEVAAFERDGTGSVASMVKMHVILSNDDALAQLFATPRFETIADVVAFEARRRRKQEGR